MKQFKFKRKGNDTLIYNALLVEEGNDNRYHYRITWTENGKEDYMLCISEIMEDKLRSGQWVKEGETIMKTINQLRDGKCIVVTQFGTKIKEFNGHYDSKEGLVFYAIPKHYEIIGYRQ